MKSKKLTILLHRFSDLLDDINSHGNCKWIQAILHNDKYDNNHSGHFDMQNNGRYWSQFMDKMVDNGFICKYKQGKFVYWVLPKFKKEFERTVLKRK